MTKLYRKRCAVVVVSDRRSAGGAEDTTGPRIRAWIEARGGVVSAVVTIPDEPPPLTTLLGKLAGEDHDLVLTTGGTGLGPRDRTPEATLAAIDRLVPGIPEWIRAATGARLPAAFLSRGVAGIAGRTLIVNLPGSPRAVDEYLDHLERILPHALSQLRAAPGTDEADTHPLPEAP